MVDGYFISQIYRRWPSAEVNSDRIEIVYLFLGPYITPFVRLPHLPLKLLQSLPQPILSDLSALAHKAYYR